MEKVELEVEQRESKGRRKARALRRSGDIPAIVYGKGIQSIPVSVNSKQLGKILSSKSGRNVIINLKIKSGAKAHNVAVLTHGLQKHPIEGQITHVDFLRINMEEAIKTKVPIRIIGQSAGVKEGGILVQGLRDVEIKCLPTEIPEQLEIDVSELKMGNSFHISDLKMPKGVEILTGRDEMVVTISAPTKEEVVTPTVEAAALPTAEAGPAEAAAEGEKKEAAPKAEEAKPKEKK